MSGPDWYRWYPAKWGHGTIGLTLEQKGAYADVINVILDRGECPEDYEFLRRSFGTNIQRAKRVVDELIGLGKLTPENGKLRQNRAETERKLSEKLTEYARIRVSKRWKNNGIAHTDSQCKPQPQPEDSSVSRPVPTEPSTETPNGVGEQADLDALYYHRGKRLLGKNAGGQLTKLRLAVGSIGMALQHIDNAEHKDSPAEYIAGVIRAHTKGGSSERNWVGL